MWVDGWSNVILDPTQALIRAQLGFRIQVRAECGNAVVVKGRGKEGGIHNYATTTINQSWYPYFHVYDIQPNL